MHVKYLTQGLAHSKHSVKVVIIGSINKYGPRVKCLIAVHLFDVFLKGPC